MGRKAKRNYNDESDEECYYSDSEEEIEELEQEQQEQQDNHDQEIYDKITEIIQYYYKKDYRFKYLRPYHILYQTICYKFTRKTFDQQFNKDLTEFIREIKREINIPGNIIYNRTISNISRYFIE